MATLSIRQKLITYLAEADDSKVKAVYTLLKNDIQADNSFSLTDEQMRILDEEHHLHIAGKSKSYSREEAAQIIKGQRAL
ncbi:hypothetical protein [Mucilaginibacter antarcticus]|uniref:Addiction module component n=1 Tax=Mucilaginibacter antarcticus TaxID=1855725 RepID=A0ABW5XL29_9SPHI